MRERTIWVIKIVQFAADDLNDVQWEYSTERNKRFSASRRRVRPRLSTRPILFHVNRFAFFGTQILQHMPNG